MKKLIILVFSFVFVSCSEQDVSEYIADSKLYVVPIERINVETVKNEQVVLVGDYSSWTAKTENTWIKIIEKNDSNKLYFNVEDNTEKKVRNGKIDLYSDGKHIKSIVIQQDSVYVNCSQQLSDFPPTYSTSILSIQSNGKWNISTDRSWIIPEVSSGTGSRNVSFVINESMSGLERQGIIKIVDQANNTYIVNVTQLGKRIYIDTVTLNAACIESKYTIPCTADAKILFKNDDWISCTQTDSIIAIDILQDNLTQSNKSGTIEMTLDGITDSQPTKIHVNQNGITFGYVDVGIIKDGKLVKFNSDTSHPRLANATSNSGGYPFMFDGHMSSKICVPTASEFYALASLKGKHVSINNINGIVKIGINGSSVFIPYGTYWDMTWSESDDYYFEVSNSGIIRKSNKRQWTARMALLVQRTDVE